MDQPWLDSLERTLVARHGAPHVSRIHVGLRQVAERWRIADGGREDLAEFVTSTSIGNPEVLEDTRQALEYAIEMLDGHRSRSIREISRFQELDEGPGAARRRAARGVRPGPTSLEDLFKNRVAFVALLNFPLTTLEQRLAEGPPLVARAVGPGPPDRRFEHRVPAEVRAGDRSGCRGRASATSTATTSAWTACAAARSAAGLPRRPAR